VRIEGASKESRMQAGFKAKGAGDFPGGLVGVLFSLGIRISICYLTLRGSGVNEDRLRRGGESWVLGGGKADRSHKTPACGGRGPR